MSTPPARPPPGTVVDVIAPAGPFDLDGFQRGLATLREAGFSPRHRPDITERHGFFAGSDERRTEELLGALAAPDSRIVWAVRGGYGVTRLLPRIPLDAIRRAGKLLVGFSDLTALHGRWLAAGLPSVHGSMVARLAGEPDEVRARLFELLLGERPPAPLEGRPLRAGVAEGPLVGGNLAVLAASCGTPFQPDFRGAVVFLEDVGERPYRLDRMLVQCEQSGLFAGAVGVAAGEFTSCEGGEGWSAGDVLEAFAARLGLPAISALPCGHGAVNHALPFGRRARLDGSSGRIEFLEPL